MRRKRRKRWRRKEDADMEVATLISKHTAQKTERGVSLGTGPQKKRLVSNSEAAPTLKLKLFSCTSNFITGTSTEHRGHCQEPVHVELWRF